MDCSPRHPKSPLAALSATVLAFVLAVASLAGPARAQAVPDVLNMAAADAEVILVVPNLAGASKKISQFMEALGMKDIPEMADPLGALKKKLGITKGLNENGAMLVSIGGIVSAMQTGNEPQIAMLIPVSDYKAFIGNFDSKDEDGISAFALPNGEPGYGKSIGGYALIGPNKDIISKYKAGNAKDAIAKAAGTIGARHLASNDISIVLNLKALGAQVRPMLKDLRAQADEGIEQGAEFAPKQMMEMGKGVITSMFDSLDALLRDGELVIFGGDMSTKGVGFTTTAQFREGSELAKFFPGGKGTAAGVTAMLPNNPYLIAMGLDVRGIDFKGMVDEFAKRMPKDNWMADMLKSATAMMPHAKRIGQAYYAPANAANLMMGLGGVSVVDTVDPAAYLKATRGYFDSMNKMKMEFGEFNGTNMNFTFTTTYKENALSPDALANLGGAKVDEYVIKFNLPKELMDQMGDAGNMVSMMLRQAGYVATLDKTVMMTTTVDTNLVKVGVEAMKQGNGLGAANLVKQVREAGLPADSNYEIFINVGAFAGLFNQVTAMAQMFEVPDFPQIPQLEVPNNLPPVALGGQVEKGGMSARFYVPMPVISWVKDVAMKIQGGEGAAPPRQPGAKPAPF